MNNKIKIQTYVFVTLAYFAVFASFVINKDIPVTTFWFYVFAGSSFWLHHIDKR